MNHGHTATPPQKRAWLYAAAVAIGLSILAAAVVAANVAAGVPRQADEGVSAHLFQLAMAAQLPLLVLTLAVSDWTRPRPVLLIAAAQIAAPALAIGFLAWSGY